MLPSYLGRSFLLFFFILFDKLPGYEANSVGMSINIKLVVLVIESL